MATSMTSTAPTPTPLPPAVETLVIDNLRIARRGLLVGGLVGSGLMVVLAAISWFALDPPDQNLWMVAAGAAPLFLLFAIPSLFDPRQAKILTTLRTRARAIVWMYVHNQRGRGAGSWVVLGFDDGTVARVTAKLGQGDETLSALRPVAPQATIGFSPDLAARFKANPASLRRAA